MAIVFDSALLVDGDKLAGGGEDAVGPRPELGFGLPSELLDDDAVLGVVHEVGGDFVEVVVLA